MKAVTVKPNQTLFDIALEQYGTAEAIGEIMRNNPDLQNDPVALAKMGLGESLFYVDVSLSPGARVLIDDESLRMRPQVVKEIEQDITTFDLPRYGTDN